jgi:hypothetical protein
MEQWKEKYTQLTYFEKEAILVLTQAIAWKLFYELSIIGREEQWYTNKILEGSLKDFFQSAGSISVMFVYSLIIEELSYRIAKKTLAKQAIISLRTIFTLFPPSIATYQEYFNPEQQKDHFDTLAYWLGFIVFHGIHNLLKRNFNKN